MAVFVATVGFPCSQSSSLTTARVTEWKMMMVKVLVFGCTGQISGDMLSNQLTFIVFFFTVIMFLGLLNADVSYNLETKSEGLRIEFENC
ncbi:hypothetical protein Hanom_Chr00s000003g01605621 [Helianthus anomalus]